MFGSFHFQSTKPAKAFSARDGSLISAASTKLLQCQRMICQKKSCQSSTVFGNRNLQIMPEEANNFAGRHIIHRLQATM
jgi:hypothetical protein